MVEAMGSQLRMNPTRTPAPGVERVVTLRPEFSPSSGSPCLRGGGALAAGAEPHGAARGLPSLESISNSVMGRPDGVGFVVSPCGCRCWFCPECAPRKGRELRDRLMPKVREFRAVLMVSLTVDPHVFDGDPRLAWRYVRQSRCVSRLVRALDRAGLLHSRRFFYVVEWQKGGFAHFHMLLDAAFIPHEILSAMWNRFRPRWAGDPAPGRPGLGFVWVSKGGPMGRAHAVRYLTKYLTKNPREGYPDWVMDAGGDQRIRRYEVSRGFWGEDSDKSPERARRRQNPRITYRVRVAACGSTCSVYVLVERIDRETGEVARRLRWKAVVALDADDLQRVPDAGEGLRSREFVGLDFPEVLVRLRGSTGARCQVLSLSRAAAAAA